VITPLTLYDTDLEKRASFDRLERATWDVCFLVSIFQVREEFVSFFVSFRARSLNALIAFIVSIPRHVAKDARSRLRSAATIELCKAPLDKSHKTSHIK
jgi:hypothetical protein